MNDFIAYKKRLSALLLAGVLVVSLSACGGQAGEGSSSAGSSGASSLPSSQESLPALPQGSPMDQPGPQQVVRSFMDALKNHDREGLEKVLGYSLENKPYAAWLGVEFREIVAVPLWEEGELGRYSLTFRIGGSDDTVFPRNSDVTLVLEVGYPPFGEYGVVNLYNDQESFFEKNPYDETQPGYAAYAAVRDYLNCINTALFDSTEQLSKREIAEYGLICCSQEYEDKYIFTPEDLRRMVELRLGIPDFDGTDQPFYIAEEGYYEVWGRGANHRNMHTTAVEFVGNTATVSVTFYGDTLCLYPVEWVEYTLRQNEDGSFRLVSGVRVPQAS